MWWSVLQLLSLTPSQPRVVVVGAGVAGLRCARDLARAGMPVRVLEASDGPGGRVRSDSWRSELGDFVLDRGFQVFLSAYPEARDALDYDALDLRAFAPGAIVQDGERRHTIADPLRWPQATLETVLSPLATPIDKARLALHVLDLRLSSAASLLQRDERNTEEHLLEKLALSPALVDAFFRPFFHGIFLAPLSKQSSRMYEYTLRAFASDDVCLPARGIGAVADQARQPSHDDMHAFTRHGAVADQARQPPGPPPSASLPNHCPRASLTPISSLAAARRIPCRRQR